MQHNVDFVERQPVFHQPIKSLEAGTGVAGKELNHFAVTPGAVLGDQMHRHIEVTQRDQRFNTVFFTLGKYRPVKRDTLCIRRQLIAVGVETAPGNGSTKNRKPHFRHQRDILFVAMIKIDRLMAGIKFVIPQRKALFLTQLDGHPMCAVGDHIDGSQSFAAFPVCPFRLVGGQCAAP